MKKHDIGYYLTEKELYSLEKRISEIYGAAQKDLAVQANAYFQQFADRQQDMLDKLSVGEITETYYRDWCRANICRGQRFEMMRDMMAERATQANEVAMSYVNDAMPKIYSINHSYAAYCLDQAGVLDNGIYMQGNFAMLDESTVRRLLVEEPDLMPNYPALKAVARGIDLAYGKKKITECITSGIIRGKSVQIMARELQQSIAGMNKVSAIRAARTAVTSAQNGGRQDMMDVAVHQMGVECRKVWISVIDARTRQSHIQMDGVMVEPDDKFPNKLKFPGDRSGAAAEVYNCRCSLGYVLPEAMEDYAEGGIFYTGNTVESYEKWLEDKTADKENAVKINSIDGSFKKQSIEVNGYPQWDNSVGSSSWTEENREKLRTIEEENIRNAGENAVVFDEKGNLLFDKKGDLYSVTFTQDEIKNMRGKTLTHNHPNNSCFSTNDINMLRRGVQEIRATTDYGTFVMQRPKHWSSSISSLDKISNEYYLIDKEKSLYYYNMARMGQTTFQQAEIDGQVATMIAFSYKFHIPFRFEEW